MPEGAIVPCLLGPGEKHAFDRPTGFPWLAGVSHELITHLLSLASRRRAVLFTCGWAITEADEQAIGLHRQHAVVEDGVRTAKSMGLRNLPSKTWLVNCG